MKRGILYRAKSRAKKTKIPFSLTPDDFEIPERCPILDIELKSRAGMNVGKGAGKGKLTFDAPSLDRIDPCKGYVPGNVWVISFGANRMKGEKHIEEFIHMSRRVVQWAERKLLS